MSETPRTWTLRGDVVGVPHEPITRVSGAYVDISEEVEVIEKAPVDAERERMLDLLRIAALTNVDGLLVPDDHECGDLFEKGLVANRRDICDEYETDLTDKGRDAIRALLREHNRLSGEVGS